MWPHGDVRSRVAGAVKNSVKADPVLFGLSEDRCGGRHVCPLLSSHVLGTSSKVYQEPANGRGRQELA